MSYAVTIGTVTKEMRQGHGGKIVKPVERKMIEIVARLEMEDT